MTAGGDGRLPSRTLHGDAYVYRWSAKEVEALECVALHGSPPRRFIGFHVDLPVTSPTGDREVTAQGTSGSLRNSAL